MDADVEKGAFPSQKRVLRDSRVPPAANALTSTREGPEAAYRNVVGLLTTIAR